MVTSDVVLLPHSGKLDLAVYCVEQGRWQGDEDFKIQESSLPPNDIRRVTAVPDASQEKVWDQVKVNLDIFAVSSPSAALNDVKMNSNFLQKVGQYTDRLAKSFEDEQHVIGVVAVSGGEIIGCDLFATPGLFAKHYDNLLQSYAAEAQGDDFGATDEHMVNKYWQKTLGVMEQEGFLFHGEDRGGKRRVHFSMN